MDCSNLLSRLQCLPFCVVLKASACPCPALAKCSEDLTTRRRRRSSFTCPREDLASPWVDSRHANNTFKTHVLATRIALATRKSEFRFLDFSALFCHFFGWFLSSFPPKFVPKFRRKTKSKFQKSAKYFFLSKYLPKKWKLPKFPVFFWQKICQITAKNWPKFFQKSAEKVPKSLEIGIRIYV